MRGVVKSRVTRLTRARSAVPALLLAAATAGTLATAAPAQAAPPAAQDTHRPVGAFRITLHDGTHTSDPVLARATLNCFPTHGSTHPRPLRSCLTLARAGGDFAALPKHNRPCTMIYKPVTVVVEGTWKGRVQGYAHTYPNRCVADAQSAGVFDLTRR